MRRYFTTCSPARSGSCFTMSSIHRCSASIGQNESLWEWNDDVLGPESQCKKSVPKGLSDSSSSFPFSSSSFMYFHAAGAAHDMDIGKVNGELMCQFTFITTAWQTEEQQRWYEKYAPGAGVGTATVYSSSSSPSFLSQRTTSSSEESGHHHHHNNSSSSNAQKMSPQYADNASPSGGLNMRPFATRKEQLLVRCSGSETFLRALAPLLSQNGTMVELAGTLTLHPTVASLTGLFNITSSRKHGSNDGNKQTNVSPPLSLALCRYTHVHVSQKALRNGNHTLKLLQSASPLGGEGLVSAIARDCPL